MNCVNSSPKISLKDEFKQNLQIQHFFSQNGGIARLAFFLQSKFHFLLKHRSEKQKHHFAAIRIKNLEKGERLKTSKEKSNRKNSQGGGDDRSL